MVGFGNSNGFESFSIPVFSTYYLSTIDGDIGGDTVTFYGDHPAISVGVLISVIFGRPLII